MTLREFGTSFVQYWQEYYLEVTTKNVLDWSIGNIFLTAVLALFGMFIAAFVFGAIAVVFERIADVWEKKGLSTLWVRLDKRFGATIGFLIMAGGTILFLIVVGLLAALIEVAQS